MRIRNLFYKNMPAEKVSGLALYAMIVLIVLVFAAFFLIGYDNAYEMDPSMNDPLCTDLLIVFMYVMVLATVIIALLSVVRGLRMKHVTVDTNGIPESKIMYFTAGGTAVLLILTFLIGSSSPVRTGEGSYADVFWLKVTDMFLYTTYILLFVAAIAAAYGASRWRRR